jgi:hypothetical protein
MPHRMLYHLPSPMVVSDGNCWERAELVSSAMQMSSFANGVVQRSRRIQWFLSTQKQILMPAMDELTALANECGSDKGDKVHGAH